MFAAVLSLIAGAIVGEMIQVETWVNRAASSVTAKLLGGSNADETYLMQVSAALVLFCSGGTGWFGDLNEGLTGDSSILITQGILDCIKACIFATLLGKIVPCLCVPQLGVYMTLFAVSGLVSPYITQDVIADFSAAGGMITLVASLRLTKIKTDIKVLNLLPGLILVFFISATWAALFV